MNCSSVNSVEKWDILMNFYGQNDSVLCHVPKGMLVFLDLFRRTSNFCKKSQDVVIDELW